MLREASADYLIRTFYIIRIEPSNVGEAKKRVEILRTQYGQFGNRRTDWTEVFDESRRPVASSRNMVYVVSESTQETWLNEPAIVFECQSRFSEIGLTGKLTKSNSTSVVSLIGTIREIAQIGGAYKMWNVFELLKRSSG